VAAPEATVDLVQTGEQETEIIGQPNKIITLGTEQIYVYMDMKLALGNGEVTNA